MSHEKLVLEVCVSVVKDILTKSKFEVLMLYVWTISAGTRFPVVSNCIHLHEHAETGHSVWSLGEKENWELYDCEWVCCFTVVFPKMKCSSQIYSTDQQQTYCASSNKECVKWQLKQIHNNNFNLCRGIQDGMTNWAQIAP